MYMPATANAVYDVPLSTLCDHGAFADFGLA